MQAAVRFPAEGWIKFILSLRILSTIRLYHILSYRADSHPDTPGLLLLQKPTGERVRKGEI